MQAVPRVPTINEDSCIHMQTGECKICSSYCEPGAINYDMKEEEVEIEVGQILLTTGFQLIDLRQMPQYGYGRLNNVHSSLEFEHMLNSTGPTGGNIYCKDGTEPRAVAIVHCIGSRDENYHKYCSRVCCMYALKFAHLVKDRTTAEVYQFYIDMRAFGKGYEEFYKRLLDEGVNMIRGKVAEITEGHSINGDKSHLLVKCEDTLIGKYREIPVDMVILCPAIEAQHDAANVKKIFSISQSPDKFFLERHPKLDPVSTMTDGIFIAGCAQGPKDIPDSVAQASAAAARILSLISLGEVAIDPIKAEIDALRCSGCRVCNNLCPYGAISFKEDLKVSEINEMLCKGCGTCVAACPSSVISGKGFTDQQILAELEGILSI
jgi:heterodisulfide reductase subunit A